MTGAEVDRYWVAGALSLLLSLYGFWVGLVALRSWFSPGPFCTHECRLGIGYAILLLVPAVFGLVLGISLIHGRPWSRSAGFVIFGAFALENLVRIDLSFRFTYRLLFLLMFVANCLGLVALAWPKGIQSRLHASATDATSVEVDKVSEPGLEIYQHLRKQSITTRLETAQNPASAIAEISIQRPARSENKAEPLARRSIIAAMLIIATILWYRIPDSLLRKDLLGVFAYERPPVPRWLAASPAPSALVIWGFLLATGVALGWKWARASALITAAMIASICLIYLPFAPTSWLRVTSGGMVIGNLLVIVVLISSGRGAK